MINNEVERFYYVYRHIRLDKNVPFYIGIGTYTDKNKYNRAFSKYRRNKFWENVINISEYKVEIIFQSDDRDTICNKEKEFISLYGRKELGGTLTNLTDGGDFTNMSKSVIEKIRETNIKNGSYKKLAEINKKIMIGNKRGVGAKHIDQYKKIFVYINNKFFKEYESIVYGAKTLNIKVFGIANALRYNTTYKGYKFYYDFYGYEIEMSTLNIISKNKEVEELTTKQIAKRKSHKTGAIKAGITKEVDVYKYDTLEYIGNFYCISEACKFLHIDNKSASDVAKNKASHTYGYIFKYITDLRKIDKFKQDTKTLLLEKKKERKNNRNMCL